MDRKLIIKETKTWASLKLDLLEINLSNKKIISKLFNKIWVAFYNYYNK